MVITNRNTYQPTKVTHLRVYTLDGTYVYLNPEKYVTETPQQVLQQLYQQAYSDSTGSYQWTQVSLFDGSTALLRVDTICKVEFKVRRTDDDSFM